MTDEGGLERHLGTTTLTLYGVGVIVGAGIYVLTGEVAGVVGNGTWLAFVLAAVVALPTGLAYAELSSRHPRSAGEAVFVDKAFGRPVLSFLVGFLVLASGVASVGAVSHGFASYLRDVVPLSESLHSVVVLGFLGALTWVNHRGIQEATWLNVTCTVVSVGALLLVSTLALPRWGDVDLLDLTPPAGGTDAPSTALLSATALAFYAYIGFEDICNVAEEVKDPVRTIPRAILLAIVTVVIVYGAVGVSVVVVVPPAELAASDVPLALVFERVLPGVPSEALSVVALFAVTNTALFNLVMGSRILYGMSRQGLIPKAFSRVHPRRRTPTWSVLTVSAAAAVLALTGFLRVLAEATSVILLIVFFAVNVALVVIRRRQIPPDDPASAPFRLPLAVPVVGALLTGYLASRFSFGAYARSSGLLAMGLLLYAAARFGRGRSRPSA